ncbi:copper transporter complex subunit Ctr4 [Microsporum ferrugineum]
MPMPTGGHHDHHDHHGMHDMGMGGNQCKISLVVSASNLFRKDGHLMRRRIGFISSTWRITSRGMFAGSCIGVILLVMSLEFLRRVGHEFDNYIAGQPSLFNSFSSSSTALGSPNGSKDADQPKPDTPGSSSALNRCADPAVGGRRSPTLLQHTLRSLLHMVQFGVAYFIMLLAMYYNGYFIICILIGAFLGSFVFSWKSQEKR